MNHITQEQAVSLAKKAGALQVSFNKSRIQTEHSIFDGEIHVLCNAAIQHYIDSTAPAQLVSGWKLVPVDATRNQLVTGWSAIAGKLDHQSLAHLYGVMLAAAPTGGEV
jgi:hypothetical protein